MRFTAGVATATAMTLLAACAAIAGIEDREATRCARETHDLCEDYDNEKARRVWNGPTLSDDPRTTGTIVPSDRSAPNAFTLKFPAVTDPDSGAQGLIGEVFRERSPDGLKVSFDIRIDELALPDIPLSDPDAGDAAPGPPVPVATIAVGVVQWNRGGVAVALRHDGAYLFLGTRPDESPTPNFYRGVFLAPMNEIVGKWSKVELAFFLGVSPPAVEVRFGERPASNPTLDPSTTQILRTTEIIFGGVVIGPSGPNTITIDNLIADFPR